jgi:fucose permease
MGSRLPNASARMSLLHAWFGAGATIAPFISTSFVKHVPKAYKYYLVAAGVAVLVAVAQIVVFEFRTAEQIVSMNDDSEEEIPLNPSGGVIKEVEGKKKQGSGDKMWSILKLPAVYAIVTYMFIYVSLFLVRWYGADDRLVLKFRLVDGQWVMTRSTLADGRLHSLFMRGRVMRMQDM